MTRVHPLEQEEADAQVGKEGATSQEQGSSLQFKHSTDDLIGVHGSTRDWAPPGALVPALDVDDPGQFMPLAHMVTQLSGSDALGSAMSADSSLKEVKTGKQGNKSVRMAPALEMSSSVKQHDSGGPKHNVQAWDVFSKSFKAGAGMVDAVSKAAFTIRPAKEEVKLFQAKAKQQLEAARRKALAKLSVLVKLLVFGSLNAGLLIYLFVLPRFQYRYLVVNTALTSGGSTYTTKASPFDQEPTTLHTADYIITSLSAAATSQSRLVKLRTDGIKQPGWNLADILNQTRTVDVNNAYFNALDGSRMIQDYRSCKSGCLTSQGVPSDLANATRWFPGRDWAAQPYGSLVGDMYITRQLFLRQLDPQYTAAYLEPGAAERAALYSNWGQPDSQLPISSVEVTRQGYLCVLGPPRRQLTAIKIYSTSCHIQIIPTNGSDWKLYWRAKGLDSSPPSITETVMRDTLTGCQSYELRIQVDSPACAEPVVPGAAQSCEHTCALVLLKGMSARPVPVHVESSSDPASDASVLYIDDKFLSLDTRMPWQQLPDQPDLKVGGHKVHVLLSNALIPYVEVSTQTGDVKLNQLRLSVSNITSLSGDVVVEDTRDTVLRYRSAGNHLCAASPLVETIPQDYLTCDMTGAGTDTRSAHHWYDKNLDGMVSTAEFQAGLLALGLSLGHASLKLDTTQQAAVMTTLFSTRDTSLTSFSLPPAAFAERLRAVVPVLASLYDLSSGRQPCVSKCVASGLDYATCSARCMWTCEPGPVNVTEPVFGKCDPSAGCVGVCGTADRSVDRFSTVQDELTRGQQGGIPWDVDGNGQLSAEEVRAAMLLLWSNCTYYLPDPASSTTNKTYCALSGRSQFQPGSSDDVSVKCGLTTGQAADWRVKNPRLQGLTLATADAAVYGGVKPTECRPFPDYDPRLNGRPYDASATPTSCPECFLLDGSRVPAHYYNRSTWSLRSYNQVMSMLTHSIFTQHELKGAYFPYFNISDDTQFNMFSRSVLSSYKVDDSVDVATFDVNMQTLFNLPYLSDRATLFSPYCHQGLWLKVRPSYTSGATSESVWAAQQSAAAVYSSQGLITQSNMPGQRLTNVPGARSQEITPCPASYGTGIQGSTDFSYFSWALAGPGGRGYRWGMALPPYCVDEAWPNGGVMDKTRGLRVYPTLHIYGYLAGQPLLPSCVPHTCGPVHYIVAQHGTIHAQVLPFSWDAWNTTGQYQTMVSNCAGPDGNLKCFYKGYESAAMRMLPLDEQSFSLQMQSCVDNSESCSEQMNIMRLSGQGVPTHRKWFWVSRKVYMEVEPAYFTLMSAGVVVPSISKLSLRVSPGFCEAASGAVEHYDWRDYSKIRAGAGSGAVDGLRDLHMERTNALFQVLARALPLPTQQSGTAQPTSSASSSSQADGASEVQALTEQEKLAKLQLNSAWFMKIAWRTPYVNETLFFSQSTAEGRMDTFVPQTVTAEGVVQEQAPGVFWRHRSLCYDTSDCNTYKIIFVDNCLVERHLVYAADGATPSLSDCAFPDGSSAYISLSAGSSSPSINETAYAAQFPLNLTQYRWYGQSDVMTSIAYLDRNSIVYQGGYGDANITSATFSKEAIRLEQDGALVLQDASGGASQDIALFLAIIFSIIIASVCGLGVMVAVIFIGLKYLSLVVRQIEVRKRAEAARAQERLDALFARIATVKRDTIRELLADDGLIKTAVDSTAYRADPFWSIEPPALTGGSGSDDCSDDGAGDDDEEEPEAPQPLSEPEKREIMHVMEEENFTLQNVKKWDLNQMEVVWQQEVRSRWHILHCLPLLDRYTLLESNRPEIVAKAMADIAEGKADGDGDESVPLLGKLDKRGTAFLISLWEGSFGQGHMLRANLVSRMAMANLVRLVRLVRFIQELLLQNFPDPFQVLDNAVVQQVRLRIMDSLNIFLKVKVVVDHELQDAEEIILGRIPPKVLKKLRDKTIRYNHDIDTAAMQGSKQKLTSEDGAEDEAGASTFLVETANEVPVVAMSADDRDELYAVQWVRIVCHAVKQPVEDHTAMGVLKRAFSLAQPDPVTPAPAKQAHDKSGTPKEALLASPASCDNPTDEAAQGGGSVSQKAISKQQQHVITWLHRLASRFVSWFTGQALGGDDDDDDEDDTAYQVIIQEGPGWVINQSAYQQHLASHDIYNSRIELLHRLTELGETKQGRCWSSRVLLPSCPALEPAQRLLYVKAKRAGRELQLEGRSLFCSQGVAFHYCVQQKPGPSTITVSTRASYDTDMLAVGSNTLRLPKRDLRPTVRFSTSNQAFEDTYRAWCGQNNLISKEVLQEAEFLKRLDVHIKKQVVPRVRGIRLRSVNQLAVMEEEDVAGDTAEIARLRNVLAALLPLWSLGAAAVREVTSLLVADAHATPREAASLDEALDHVSHLAPPPLPPASAPSTLQGLLQGPGASPASNSPKAGGRPLFSRLGGRNRPGTSDGGKQAAGSPAPAPPVAPAAVQPNAVVGLKPAASQAGFAGRGVTQAGDGLVSVAGIAPPPTGSQGPAAAAALLPSTEAAHNTRMFKLLLTSNQPLAAFLRDTCEATANFTSDYVGLTVLTNYLRMWCSYQRNKALKSMLLSGCEQMALERAAAACMPPRAREAAQAAARLAALTTYAACRTSCVDGNVMTMQVVDAAAQAVSEVLIAYADRGLPAGSFVQPLSQSTAVQGDEQGSRDIIVLPGGQLAHTASSMATSGLATQGHDQTGVSSDVFSTARDARTSALDPGGPSCPPSGLHPHTEAALIAMGQPSIDCLVISPQSIDLFGLKLADEDVHQLQGVMANLSDLDDDPEDVSRLMWTALHAFNVAVHTVFIWALALPLVAVCVGYQQVFQDTTAIQPVLTLQLLRENPAAIGSYEIEGFLYNLLLFAMVWICFCYIQLTIYYTVPSGSSGRWRSLLCTLFWLYLLIMIAVMVAYLLMIMCWLILGAVVNPNRYLPYSVATITLIAHTNATYLRLKQGFMQYKDRVQAVVLDAFQSKLKAAMDTIQKATGTVSDLAAAAEQEMQGLVEQANQARMQMMGGYADGGQAGGMAGAATMLGSLLPGSNFNSSLRGSSGIAPAGLMSVVGMTGTGLPGRSSLPHANAVVMPGMPQLEGGRPAAWMTQADGHAGLLPLPSAFGGSIRDSAPRPGDGSTMGEQSMAAAAMAAVPTVTAMPAAAAGAVAAAAGSAAAVASIASRGSAKLEPFQIFTLYADEDGDGLNYPGFCSLLNHLQIKLPGHKVRELFLRFDTSGDNVIGYREFEACYSLIQDLVVQQNLEEAGMTRGRLIGLLMYAVGLLMLLFIFIFVGVAAFTGSGTVGAVVNSALAAGSGIALNLKGDDKGPQEVAVKVGDETHTENGEGTASS